MDAASAADWLGACVGEAFMRGVVENFLRKVRENGGAAAYARSLEEVVGLITDWATSWGVDTVVLGSVSRALKEFVESAFRERLAVNVVEVEEVAGSLGRLREKSLGLFRGRAGVAETGGIVVADDWKSNLASLIPEYSVAILKDVEVVGDYGGLVDLIRGTHIGGLVIITGPSGSADIELEHVTGVHGPVGLGCIVAECELDA